MEKEKVLGWLPKNIIETIRVATGFWKGVPCTDVRAYYRTEPPTVEQIKENKLVTEDLKPSKKGLMMKNTDFIELMEQLLIPHYEKLMKPKKDINAKEKKKA